LKHVIVRNNEKNEVMLIIVVSKKSQYNQLVKVLEKLYNENKFIKSVYISVKIDANNVILGEDTKHIFGDKYLKEEMEGIKFNIYPDSFFQINKSQAIKLYDKAIEFLGESRNNTVIDAFSGTGTIAMALSSKVRKAIGIESVESSVNAARETAVENKIDNVEFINGKVEKVLPELLKNEKAEAIIFDPPRRGIDEKALKSVVKNKIKKIVYISCNPGTFARDTKFLIENGYKLEKVSTVDMFPQTNHVEVVALIQKE
jgi:23S rRNA (uracil-5-)-methyltransferase rumA